ncbi:peroxiredoxin [Candidatus Dependentiae bacterium]|nr:peroxiredoxin [Candidatus Dependentiae bacterium]
MKFKYLFFCIMLISHISYSDDNLLCKAAPLFTAQAVFPDGTIKKFDLKDFIGQKLVLYFYPMDNTPGCTKQAKNFRDNIQKLKDQGITLIGISCDSIKSHKNFQKKYALPYILVSDSRRKRTILKKYKINTFFMSKRRTFLVDACGNIFKKFDHVNIEEQVDEILKAFKKNK